MAEQYSIVYMYHNFFIHSSAYTLLGCLHVLAIVSSAAMKNEIHVSFSILVSSDYKLRSGIAGLCSRLNAEFQRIAMRDKKSLPQ